MIEGLASIIVVNRNGAAYLQECLDSLHRQSWPKTELIVVDNASTDGSLQWLRLHAAGLTLIELPENRGFAGGVNAGIRAARGEFIALLNNDAVADEGWLAALVAAAADADTGMIASKILFYDRRSTIDKAGHLLYPDGLNRGRGAGEADRGQYDLPDETFFPDGCAALYKSRMLERVGLFDEQFFAYGDDADLGLRARWQGWKCLYAPEARVYHHHSRTLGKYSAEKAFLVERNRFWVAVKLLPLPVLLLSPLFTFWRFCWHVSSILAARGLAGGVRREASAGKLLLALLRAYASGLAGLPSILKKRRAVFRSRRVGTTRFCGLMRRFRISARELALRD